jgi:hypothetical protein
MEWLLNNVYGVLGGAGIVLTLGILIKKLPSMLDGLMVTNIEKLFAMGDANDDWLLVQIMIWAEKKYGDKVGEAKAKEVVDKIISWLPLKYKIFVGDKSKAKATELVTKIFQTAKDRIDKEIAEHNKQIIDGGNK